MRSPPVIAVNLVSVEDTGVLSLSLSQEKTRNPGGLCVMCPPSVITANTETNGVFSKYERTASDSLREEKSPSLQGIFS